MSKQHALSDPLTLRLPSDVLAEIEQIAEVCERSRSWVMVRALKSYLAGEGREILDLARARDDVEAGRAFDLDDVIEEVETIVKGTAA